MSFTYSFKQKSGGGSGGGGGGHSCGSSGGSSSGGGGKKYTSSVRSNQGFSGGSHCGRRSRQSSGGGICGGFGSGSGGGSFGGGSSFGGSGGYGGGFGGGGDDAGFLSSNEKSTMQNLNGRLASYLDKVRNLEAENKQLEHLIQEWHQKNDQSSESKDYSPYYKEIDKLVNELISVTVDSNRMMMDIDNIKMAADDFRMKYETERALRQNVEGDLQGLHPLLDKLTLEKSSLEIQYESLQEELCHLKKNEQEEKKKMQGQTNGNVTVEINSSPGLDLEKTLEDVRCEYEEIIKQNCREVEEWYEDKMDEIRQQMNSSSQEIEGNNKQVTDLTRQCQSLEIEMQSQLSILQSLKSNLNDTEGHYSMQLQQAVRLIEPVEAELASIKCEIQSQNQEYQTLLGIKTRLEQEISQYHQLLEEGNSLAANIPQGGGGHGGYSSSGSCGGISRGRGGRVGQSYGGIPQGGGGRSQPCGGISQGGGGRESGCSHTQSSSPSQSSPSSCQSRSGSGGCCLCQVLFESKALCLEGDRVLERGVTMEEVGKAIRTVKSGSSLKR